MNTEKPLVILAVTVPESLGFFKGKITYLKEAGFDVALVSSPGIILDIEGAEFYPVPMKREISPLSDIKSLWNLWKLFRRVKPTIVNTGTPKASLLVGLAALLAGVPNRIYTSHGLRLETTQGWKKIILNLTEKISAFSAHHVVCVSQSLREKLISLKLVKRSKTKIIHNGSCRGVEINSLDEELENNINTIKKELGIKEGPIIGFVGRFTKDKGICELVEAFDLLKVKYPNLKLLMCGDFESGDPVPEDIRRKIIEDTSIVKAGYVKEVLPYYYIMDMLVLPSYREGFPSVVLEANSLGKPVVASRVTGCMDAVIDGETGFLVPSGNSSELAKAIETLLSNPDLAINMGAKGKSRVVKDFRPNDIWSAYVDFYINLVRW